MYSKQQASHLRQEFWTAFGKYIQPVLSSEGAQINWINYKTGAKNIAFKMQAGKGATIAIVLTHADDDERNECYEKLQELRSMLEEQVGEEWTWAADIVDENGKLMTHIYAELEGVNIFNKADWPELISFFKPRMIALDAFWNNVKHVFDVW